MVHSTIFDTQMSVLYRGVTPAESFPKKLKIFRFIGFRPTRRGAFLLYDFYLIFKG